ncbi:MAG: Rpn family recombination-promoting nuclease/putative transposase [Erysipelotrichaceae bacterium]
MKIIDYDGKQLLSPKKDLVFKYLFVDKPNKGLQAFLNDVLNLNIKHYQDISIENSEVSVERVDGKLPRMDLKVKVDDFYINVEIQLSDKKNLETRNAFYRSKMISNSLEKGEDYKKLKKYITLWILDYTIPQTDYAYDYTQEVFKYSNSVFSSTEETHIIQLPLFNWEEELSGRNKWIGLLNIRDKIDVDKLKARDETMNEVIDKLEKLSADKKLRLQLEAEEDAEREYVSYMNVIKREATAQGLAEGLAEGKVQGLAEGKAEGKAEGYELGVLETAKKLKSLNTPIHIIMQATGLSEEKIENL